MQPDMVVLAAPEIVGLPSVISVLIAVGVLAAALSTAGGLLLTIANASHDVYYCMVDHRATSQRCVKISKNVASLNTGNILFLVGAAFSLAGSSLFPALVLGVFWKRTTQRGVVAGMIAGLVVCVYYIVSTYPFFMQLTGFAGARWFGIEPISSVVFDVPAGFAVAIVVSLLDRKPDAYARAR